MIAGRRDEVRSKEAELGRAHATVVVYGSSAIIAYVFHCLCISRPSHHIRHSLRIIRLSKLIYLSINILINHRISHPRHSLLASNLVDRYIYQSTQPLAQPIHLSRSTIPKKERKAYQNSPPYQSHCSRPAADFPLLHR